jgi:hypothetical protein
MKIVFLGTVANATLLNVAGQNVYKFGDEFAVTTPTAKAGNIAVYAVTEQKPAFKVAIHSTLEERIGRVYESRKTTTLVQNQTALRELLTSEAKELIPEAIEEAAKLYAVDEARAQKEAAERAIAEEKAAAERARKVAAANQAKELLKSKMAEIKIGDSVYNLDLTVKGTVLKVDLTTYSFTVKVSKKENKVLQLYDIATEEEVNDAFFNNRPIRQIISHNKFKEQMAIISAAEWTNYQNKEEEFNPGFDFSSDRIVGAERNADGEWEYFSRDIVDNSKQEK